MNDRRVILIDGDVLVYQGAFVGQRNVQWEEDLWTVHADIAVSKAYIQERIDSFKEKLEANDVIVALSDRTNFRRKLNPLYKANRRESLKPIGLKPIRHWLTTNYKTECWPNLEADDVLSILATERPNRLDHRIIISIDKDFHGVPGHWYDYNKDEYHHPSAEEADKHHLIQAISGDHTDGYKGVPSVGVTRARAYLDKEGYTWEAVVKAYDKVGLPESEALMNAWMARLLRKKDYNLKHKELSYLWMPKSYQEADKRKYSKLVHTVTGTLGEADSTLFPQAPFVTLRDVSKPEPSPTVTTTG